MTDMPPTIPILCGKVRRNPKFAPDAISMRLFGPGVTVMTNAKPRRALRIAKLIARASDIADAQQYREQAAACRLIFQPRT
ncbi:hypothetical protein [Rhodovulum sulfidophilum]|uniref:hypothetical protein n=1 Tax=Rhodovulum sulfidophilum TaxID=35806 RepID=UPI001F16DB78|nr:hypothetical protein [Rhodovulum sulfidophilum]MCE8441106.1 hypothetical protein [Rhodovulum sulfidophilum]